MLKKQSIFKLYSFIVLLIGSISFLGAQEYQVSFSIANSSETPANILVENINRNTSLFIKGDNILTLELAPLGSKNLNLNNNLNIYPHPANEYTKVEFVNNTGGEVHLSVFDLTGRKMASTSDWLSAGTYTYSVSGMRTGINLINIRTETDNSTGLVNVLNGSIGVTSIGLVDEDQVKDTNSSIKKSTDSNPESISMPYSDGDVLRFTAYLGSESSTQQIVPTQSTTIEFSFPVSESLYGIKHGKYYGYINKEGEIVVDSLSKGFIGELQGEKTFIPFIAWEYEDGSIVPKNVLHWDCFYSDGRHVDIAEGREYEPQYYSYGEVELEGEYRFYNKRAIFLKKSESSLESLCGFVDEDGNEVIPARYKWVSTFSDGLAAVLDPDSNKVGYINTLGEYVIQPQYGFYLREPYNSKGFYNGKAVVINNHGYRIIDAENNILADLSELGAPHLLKPSRKISEGLLRIYSMDLHRYGFANMQGEWEIGPELNYGEVGDFTNGFALVVEENYPGNYCFINKTGNVAFPETDFAFATDFNEHNLAWVIEDPGEGVSGRKGYFIDDTGNPTSPNVYSGAYVAEYKNGLALVYDSEWKYINLAGETVLVAPGHPKTTDSYSSNPSYIIHGHFNEEGIAMLEFDDGTFGYINLLGEIIWQSEEPLN